MKYDKVDGTHHNHVAKLIRSCHGIIIQHTSTSQPARVCVVSKDDELILLPLVADKVETLLDVGHYNPTSHGMDRHDKVGNVLQ